MGSGGVGNQDCRPSQTPEGRGGGGHSGRAGIALWLLTAACKGSRAKGMGSIPGQHPRSPPPAPLQPLTCRPPPAAPPLPGPLEPVFVSAHDRLPDKAPTLDKAVPLIKGAN